MRIGWLELFHHLLLATFFDGRRVRLLETPAETDNPVAATAMTMALDPANYTQPSGIPRAAQIREPHPRPTPPPPHATPDLNRVFPGTSVLTTFDV